MDSDLAEAKGLLNEGVSTHTTNPRQRWIAHSIKHICWVLQTLLLLLVLILLIEQRWREGTHKETQELTGDLTGFAPRFAQQIVELTPDLGFVPENTSDFWTDPVQKRWLSIVPRGLGYVRVQDPAAYHDLPTPIQDYPEETVFTTSVAHQLHCLYNILSVYAAMTGGNPNDIPTEMTWHLQHCFEYLRLNIMCCGDVALEGAETTFPDGFDGSDGWDSKHICKDYTQVYNYMDSRRANDTLWI